MLTGALSVSCGAIHTCALLADGTVRCWGDDGSSQAGRGDGGVTLATPVFRQQGEAAVPLTGVEARWSWGLLLLRPVSPGW
ncbi:hypothetical protein ACLESD_06690 [Pyxidicoccus sp. 3LFB2]